MVVDSGGDETPTSVINRFKCYDDFELDDVGLSRLAVEALLSVSLREKLETRFSHYPRFQNLPGQIIFMMVLDTCNASAEIDVEGAHKSFDALSLSSFLGKISPRLPRKRCGSSKS